MISKKVLSIKDVCITDLKTRDVYVAPNDYNYSFKFTFTEENNNYKVVIFQGANTIASCESTRLVSLKRWIVKLDIL